MDEVFHLNALPAQVEAILSEVWIKLDVDKQLQQAQDKIDEINNGHSEIGEIFDNVEQGLIDIDNELHPTNSNGERTSFYADIADTLTIVKSGIHDLHLRIDELETCQDNTNDDQNSDEGFVIVYSDDSTSPPTSPKCLSGKEEEAMETTSTHTEKLETTPIDIDTGSHHSDTDQPVELSDTTTHADSQSDSIPLNTPISTCSSTQITAEDGCETITEQATNKQDDGCTSTTPVPSTSSCQPPSKDSNSVVHSALPSKVTNKPSVTKTPPKQPSKGASTPNSNKISVKSEPVNAQSGSSAAKGGRPDPYVVPDVIDLCGGDDTSPMEDEQDDVIECLQIKKTKTHIQDSTAQLTQDSRVLAKKRNNLWLDGTIIGIVKDNNSQLKYKLQFDKKGRALVSGKHIAIKSYPKPSKLNVGSRVVAEYENEAKSPTSTLYAGVIAEVPLNFNKARYLIFFDDGYAQYLRLKKIHLVYEASDNVWEDVPDNCREFIQEYLEKYPERPMVRLHRGQCIKTEWKGVWWRAKVVEVDGSLVNMNFPSDDRNEWLYRGSPRLEPLHRELETAKYLRQSGRLIAGSSVTKKRGGPCVEYQRVNPDYLISENDILALAEGKILPPKPDAVNQPSQSKGVFSTRTVEQMPVVQWSVITFRKWCESHDISSKFEDLSNEKLAVLLERVYRDGPEEQPDIFNHETLHGLRSALNTFLTEPPVSRKIDIYRDPEYVKANQAFKESIKAKDKSKVAPTKLMVPQPGLSRRDMVKLLKSGLVSLSNPLGLLRLVWLFMQPFIGKAKGKVKSLDLDLLQKKDVIGKFAKSGLPYYEINSPILGLSGGQEQRIYATGNRFYCPYHAISLYISKLNPNCLDFLQQPRTKISFKLETIWFEAKPMNSSAINTLMTDIAAAAKLSRQYTNVDIRATPWANLQEAIEDFSEILRSGYRKNVPPQTQNASAVAMKTTTTTTPTTAGSTVGKHANLPPVVGRINKPISQQHTVKPSSQHGRGNPTVRQLLYQTPTTKQPTTQTDSDDDVIIIETSEISASERLIQMSHMVKAEQGTDRQQTAKKSTSSNRHHHHHQDNTHRQSSHRHGTSSYDSLKANAQFSSRSMPQSQTSNSQTKKMFVAHQCGWQCVAAFIPDAKRKEKIRLQNPLRVPGMYGWIRRLAKRSGNGKRHVVYHAPCGRSMRNMAEIDRYLTQTKMKDICVDAFTFNPFVYTKLRQYRINQRPFLKIHDLSKGTEPVPVSLVNEVDGEQSPDVKYIAHRQPEKGSKIVSDTGFLICCDCKDNCKDNASCACRKLTQKTAEDFPEINKNPSEIGYKFRRLKSLVSTGIYECNSKCSCSKQCHNRVAQNGLRLRLQVFKTDKRGWGLRCLDDIPEGAFVCTYAGQLWGAEEANKRGQMYGDEYFAELDHIEVVENSKEGYESDPMEDEGISDSKESILSNSSNSEQCLTSDDDYHVNSEDSDTSSIVVDVENQSDDSNDLIKVQSGDSVATKMVFRRQQFEPGTGSVVEGSCWSVAFPDKDSSQSKVEAWVNSNPIQATTEDSVMNEATAKPANSESSDNKTERRGPAASLADSTDRSIRDGGSDVDYKPLARKSLGSKREHVAVKRSGRRDSSNKEADPESSRDSSTLSIIKYGYNTSPGKVLDKSQVEAFKRRSHTSRLHMRKKTQEPCGEMKAASVTSDGDTSDSEYSSTTEKGKGDTKSVMSSKSQHGKLMPSITTVPTSSKDTGSKDTENRVQVIRTRSFFGESSGHVMDAKFIGNLGRYLNHSCSPNLFVQNVFVDSHDLRFPWVAFFARERVRAGSELTWDYNYDVGSVPGKSLLCLCGSRECRGRLL